MINHCRSRRSRCLRDRQSESVNGLRAAERRLPVLVWGQCRFLLLPLPATTAGRYQQSFAAMLRFLISFFGSLALTGSDWVLAESDTATLESIIEKYRADVVLASGGSAEASPLFMSQAERRIAFAHFDVLFPTRMIRSSGEASPLPSAPVDLNSVRFTANEKDMTVGELLDSEHLMGLLVVHDGKVLMEHYAPDHGADVRWVTFR